MCIRCDLIDRFGEKLVFIDPEEFDEAIIGVTHDQRVTYDAMLCVNILSAITDNHEPESIHALFDELVDDCIRQYANRSPSFTWIDWEMLEEHTKDFIDDDEDEHALLN